MVFDCGLEGEWRRKGDTESLCWDLWNQLYIYRKLLIFPVDKTHLKLSHEYLETNYELFTKWKTKISMCEAMLIAEFSVGNDITYTNLPQFIGYILIKWNFYFLGKF